MSKSLLRKTLLALAVLSLTLSGCGGKTPAATQAPIDAAAPAATEAPKPTEVPAAPAAGDEKVVTISFITGDPASLNPLYMSTWGEECAAELFLLPLWNIDDDGKYHPELVTEVPTLANGGVSADGLTITLKLRPEAVWSDGAPVTAGDVIFTYNMIMDSANTVYSQYPYDTYVESLTAVDEKTVEIKLSGVYADWATSFFTGISRVLPKHILEPVYQKDGTLDNAAWNRLPDVVNGPYLVTEFEPGSHMIFVRWLTPPRLPLVSSVPPINRS